MIEPGTIICGDCLELMRGWPDGCVDAVITDPPYGLRFMGQRWDYQVPSIEIWAECLRVLKDGGRLLAFSGARTQHRMVCNIEDAGFVIEDCAMWIYGQGFPKHKSKLKPAYEPICVARKGSVTELNIDAGRVHCDDVPDGRRRHGGGIPGNASSYELPDSHGEQPAGRWPANVILDGGLEPVLCLRYNISDGIREAIEAYYKDYRHLRYLRQAVPDLPVAAKEQQRPILQQALLPQGAECSDARQEPSALRGKAQPAITGKDAPREAAECEARQGSSQLHGAMVQPWLSLSESGGVVGAGLGTGTRNDSQESSRDAGASADNGAGSEQGIETIRSGASSQWNQARQPDRESGTDQQLGAQNDAQASSTRAKGGTGGMRLLEVFAGDVPACWQEYFVDSGPALRPPDSAAAMLDEQSGVGTSTDRPRHNNEFKSVAKGRDLPHTTHGHSDTGGASRFLYCAKASRAERNAGCGGLPVVIGKRTQEGGDDTRGRPLPINHNAHPTVKPLSLMQWLLSLVTEQGDLILDPFCGSGSTLVAAERLGRRWIGIDIDEHWCEVARRRTAQRGLFAEAGNE